VKIRGSGLSYGLELAMDVEAGVLRFILFKVRELNTSFNLPTRDAAFKSSNPIKAFEEAAAMMRGLIDGSVCIQIPTVQLH